MLMKTERYNTDCPYRVSDVDNNNTKRTPKVGKIQNMLFNTTLLEHFICFQLLSIIFLFHLFSCQQPEVVIFAFYI